MSKIARRLGALERRAAYPAQLAGVVIVYDPATGEQVGGDLMPAGDVCGVIVYLPDNGRGDCRGESWAGGPGRSRRSPSSKRHSARLG